MLSINTNLPSLIAQNNLKNSTLKLNTAIERMTTGFKINNAKDNAANYSIVTNTNTKLGSYQIAEDNVAMGLDLLTTAGDSLNVINDKLVRLRALAEQAANGTYGEQSLKAINSEADALINEIQRQYKNTEYNGIKLFGETGGNFIEEVKYRDTSSMTKLSSIASDQEITDGTYSISTEKELAQLAEMTNAGKITGGEFVLAKNIDLSSYSSDKGWSPIGNHTNSFQGTFDGNGFVISNLYINRPNENYQGLFGKVEGEIKNIGLENADIKGRDSVGKLVGYNNGGCITNSYATGNVSGKVFVGGLVGISLNNSSITDSYTTGDVSGNEYIGGLAGSSTMSSSITNSYATGDISGEIYVGGLVGAVGVSSSVDNSYATGNVSGNNNIGGLVGNNNYNSIITNSYATGNASGNEFVGGLVGYNYLNAIITNSYSTGNVSGNEYIGGLAGYNTNNSIITNSYYNSETSGQSGDNYNAQGVTTAELNTLIQNGSLLKSNAITLKTFHKPQTTTFQVGISSTESSSITLDTGFGLNVSRIRGIGIDNTDYFSHIDSLVNTVSAKQTEYGAAQNRLESALDEIATQTDNLTSSRSTLRDADIAEVSSKYIRHQILQQASATLLATANQTPALALQLL